MRSLAAAGRWRWPALAIARPARRRQALNQALHELRRPLQALALAHPGAAAAPARSTLVERLRCASSTPEINGGAARAPAASRSRCRALVGGGVGRWRARAGSAGARIELRWRGGPGAVGGDPAELAQALDNLIVNAIEHGGPPVTVDAAPQRGEAADRRRRQRPRPRPPARADSPAEVIARLRGRARRGHGLNVVARSPRPTAAASRSSAPRAGSIAVLELPLAGWAGAARGGGPPHSVPRPSLAAAAPAALVDGYGSSVASSYGELRPVVVAVAELPRGTG